MSECVICLESIKEEEGVTLPCDHKVFHLKCILKCVQQTCPLCREDCSSVFEEDLMLDFIFTGYEYADNDKEFVKQMYETYGSSCLTMYSVIVAYERARLKDSSITSINGMNEDGEWIC